MRLRGAGTLRVLETGGMEFSGMDDMLCALQRGAISVTTLLGGALYGRGSVFEIVRRVAHSAVLEHTATATLLDDDYGVHTLLAVVDAAGQRLAELLGCTLECQNTQLVTLQLALVEADSAVSSVVKGTPAFDAAETGSATRLLGTRTGTSDGAADSGADSSAANNAAANASAAAAFVATVANATPTTAAATFTTATGAAATAAAATAAAANRRRHHHRPACRCWRRTSLGSA
jgi:hypothetical protein